MPEQTNFDLYKGTAPRLRFTLVKPENIAGWEFTWELVQSTGVLYLTDEVNVVDANNGVVDVQLDAVDTGAWTPKPYTWRFKRTNPGFEDVLAFGACTVKSV